MSDIATFVSDLQMLAKFLGIARAAGLPDNFYQRVIDSPEYRVKLVTAVTKGFEMVDIRLPVESRDFPTWRTVKLGKHTSVDLFMKALKKAGMKINDWGMDILKRTVLATELVEIELVRVSVADLGFTGATRRDEIYRRAQEFGLELCPAEVGPALREQYLDQPLGEWLLIGMDPIVDSDGCLSVFFVGRSDGDRWLFTSIGRPDYAWYPGSVWVFSRSKR